jgi:hypothetical protein
MRGLGHPLFVANRDSGVSAARLGPGQEGPGARTPVRTRCPVRPGRSTAGRGSCPPRLSRKGAVGRGQSQALRVKGGRRGPCWLENASEPRVGEAPRGEDGVLSGEIIDYRRAPEIVRPRPAPRRNEIRHRARPRRVRLFLWRACWNVDPDRLRQHHRPQLQWNCLSRTPGGGARRRDDHGREHRGRSLGKRIGVGRHQGRTPAKPGWGRARRAAPPIETGQASRGVGLDGGNKFPRPAS